MTVTSTPIFPQTIGNGLVQILPADTTADKTIYTAGANGSKVESILVSSTDTSSRTLQFKIVNGGNTYILGTIACAANSGFTAGTVLLNVLGNVVMSGLPKDADNNPYLYLASGSVLKVSSLTTITTAKTISVTAQVGDY